MLADECVLDKAIRECQLKEMVFLQHCTTSCSLVMHAECSWPTAVKVNAISDGDSPFAY